MKKMLTALVIAVLCAAWGVCGWAEAPTEEPLIIDLDLSQMSDTIVYAEVFQMMIDPEAYIGKVIRLSGWFDVFSDVETGMIYTSCNTSDATACCAQGIEFVWAGEHVYPQDYPAPGADLTVTGRFETYLENGYEYVHLVDAQVEWAVEESV